MHILQRVGRVWGSGLARGRLGGPSERQDDEQRDKPSLPVHRFLPVAYHGEKFAATVPYGRSTLNLRLRRRSRFEREVNVGLRFVERDTN